MTPEYADVSREGLIDMLDESESLLREDHSTISSLRARITELEAGLSEIRNETQSVAPVPYGGAVYRIIQILDEVQAQS